MQAWRGAGLYTRRSCLDDTYVSFYTKLPFNRKKKRIDDEQSNSLSVCQQKCGVSMTELMKQGKLVLGEVTFLEHTLCILQSELSSFPLPSAADTSFLCNEFQLKTWKDFFSWLIAFWEMCGEVFNHTECA